MEEMRGLAEGKVLTHLVQPEAGFNKILDGEEHPAFEGWTFIVQQTASLEEMKVL